MNYQAIIIDDDPLILMIMKKMMVIHSFHHSPIAFDNGKSALNYLKEVYCPRENYVLFLDINMPVMNGWRFLDEIKNIVRPENTFVVITTSSISVTDKEQAYKYSLVLKFLSKPILGDTILQVKQIVDKKISLS